jgi:hypothetical protein
MLLELSASLCLRQNNLFLLILYFETIDLKRLARGFVTKTRRRSSEIFRRSLFLPWKSYVPTAKNIWNPMVDHVNQKWYGCVPIVAGPAPQPDYSAGCKETIFTKDQFRKLEPFIRGWKGTPFMATAWMYFPYLTMEVKCGNEGLNIADRQNAHSSGVAVKQVVDLYQ